MTSEERAAAAGRDETRPAIPARPWLIALASSVAALGVATAIAPLLPIDPTRTTAEALAAYAIAFAAVSAMTLATAALAPAIAPRALLLALAPIAAAIATLAIVGLPADTLAGAALVLALLLSGGTLFGAAIGSRIEHPGHLVVVAIASSIADAWSVLAPGAPSAVVAADGPLLSALALPFPMVGTTAIEPLLGVGDVVFAALYLSASRAHALGVRRTIAALAIALAATAAAVIATRAPIPALPFLGAAVLIAHPQARTLRPSERRTAAIALGLLALAIGALVLSR